MQLREARSSSLVTSILKSYRLNLSPQLKKRRSNGLFHGVDVKAVTSSTAMSRCEALDPWRDLRYIQLQARVELLGSSLGCAHEAEILSQAYLEGPVEYRII